MRTLPSGQFLKRTILSSAVLAACSLPGFAQADDAILPAVTIRGERDKPSTNFLNPSAAQQREQLDAIPGGTNLIEPQQESRLVTLRDALDYQPGVVVQDFFGGNDQPRVNIRGSGIQSNPLNRGVLLLQDGLPLNEADGSFVIGVIDARNSSLISVRRGANATAPGSTTLGGELDFQSLTGVDDAGRLRLEGGSFGRTAGQFSQGWVGERSDAHISVGSDSFDGYRHHSKAERESVQANVGLRGEGGFENRTYLNWTDLRFQIPSVVPKDRISSNPTGVMGDGNTAQDTLLNVYKRDPRRDTTQLRLANRSTWGDEHLRQEVGVYVQNTDDLFNNQTNYTITHSNTVGAQWELNGKPAAAGGDLGYRLALAWSRSDMDRDLYATNPQTGQQMQRFGTFDLLAENRNARIGADWRFAPALTLVGDVQWSQVTRDAGNNATGVRLDQQWTYANPKLGINWNVTPQTRWYANVSQSHEAPTFWEIVSATVAPASPATASAALVKLNVQHAATLELGGQGKFGTGAETDAALATQWSAAVYRSQVSDELISTTDASGVNVGTYNYVGGTRHQGVEAGLNGGWALGSARSIDYRLSWTYSDFRFKGGVYSGNRIAGVPRQLIAAELLYHEGAWRYGPNLRWLPLATPTDHANTAGTEQDPYALLGFKIDWRSGPWSAYLQADNLTGRTYASAFAIRDRATAAQPGYLPGLGRSLVAGATYRF